MNKELLMLCPEVFYIPSVSLIEDTEVWFFHTTSVSLSGDTAGRENS